MKKCAILFFIFLVVLAIAASLEKKHDDKEPIVLKGQELTLAENE